MELRRLFDWESQQRFAQISGDVNPIHMDPVAARRTPPGAPIVHGIHSLIWILDCFSRSDLYAPGVRSLKAQFLRPVYVGDELTLELSSTPSKVVRARVLVGHEEVATASLHMEEANQSMACGGAAQPSRVSPPQTPAELNLQDMESLQGCLTFGPRTAEIETLFPSAARAFGIQRIAALVHSSCLVGMVVPGLHSMFSGLEIAFSDDDSGPADGLNFAVTSVVKRFRLVRIAIAGAGMHGSLETMSRMPPVAQSSCESLSSQVAVGEFRDSIALVVGGSRGLGEVAAKLIAAGGGRVFITYAQGRSEADAVAAEINQCGGTCRALPYDVRRPASEQLASVDMAPTHVYYFATPPIFRRKQGLFDLSRFEEFNAFYVSAFFELAQACIRLRPTGLRFFYPSSTALDSRPAGMTEYTMAKGAAEILCSDMSRFIPGVHILTSRLPRLPTDQTSSVVQTKSADPVEVLLPIVRTMHSQSVPVRTTA